MNRARLGIVNLKQHYATTQKYRFNLNYIPFRPKSRAKVLGGGRNRAKPAPPPNM